MQKKSIVALIVLLPVFLLQGCWLANMPVYVPPHVPSQPVIDAPPVYVEETPATITAAHGRFTLRYEPVNSLNPILALNRDNISITSLMYESLFILSNNLTAVPLLCESWDTEDFITFRFNIHPDIRMHDGQMLTSDDVAYSLRQARARGRHRNKLACIESVSTDGELTVVIRLKSANARLTRLLDIPIIRADTMEDDIPPGTGPYMFPNPDNLILTRFTGHRDFAQMPVQTIYLQVCNDNELTELFDQGSISLLWDDPAGSFEIRINRDYEPRYYDTTTLQYLGFNADNNVLQNPDARRAIGCAVNRQYIVESIMNDPRPGQTIAAPVAISPVFDMYDKEAWERQGNPEREMADLLSRARIADYNEDGLLEISSGVGSAGTAFTLRFLVNVENSYKVAAAEYIAESLRQVGFSIDLRVQSFSEFTKNLQEGNFDIFYGEVQLGADFDISPLLLPDSPINYGKTGSSVLYGASIANFMASATAEEVSINGKQLCDDVRIYAPFIPILYKRYAIYYPLGLVSDAAPTQSGVFYNFDRWAIDLDLLT